MSLLMETTIHLELEIKIDFDAYKTERMTRHYPGYPAHIEINKVILPTPDKVLKEFEDEIEEWCWDEVREDERERAISRMEDI